LLLLRLGQTDMERMCHNCRVYNAEGSDWFAAANGLSKVIKRIFNA
jgi:Bromodomain